MFLNDNDRDIKIGVEVNTSTVSENGGAKTITVTAYDQRDNSLGDLTVTIDVGRTGDGATEGTDYATVNSFTISIPSNTQGRTWADGSFTLTPTNDSSPEGAERITVYANDNIDGGKGGEAFINLTDDDGGSITLSTNTSSVSESTTSATTVTVTATANKTQSAARTVTVRPGQGGSATYGTDYSVGSDSFDITIASGQSSGTGTFTVTPKQDTVVEGSETIGIAGSATGFSITGTSVTLSDDDTTPTVNLSLSPTSVAEDASGTKVTVTAAFSNTSTYTADKTVSVSVGGNGTATSGTDYAAVSNFNITIPKGQTSGTGSFTLTPTDDSVFEGSETIGVSGTSTGLTVNSTTLSLTDDDNAAVTINDASASEGDDITFTVTLSHAVAGGLTVTPSFTDSTAVESTDYDENTAALTFTGTANETQTFTVSTTEDTTLEANETFTVGLTVSDAPTGVTATDTGTGTINNDDDASITIDDGSASEGDKIKFTVKLGQAVTGGVSVTPTYTNGTASSSDYTTNTTPLTFDGTAGQSIYFHVYTTEDTDFEGDETFTVGLSVTSSSLGVTVTAADTGTGTINNDDGTSIALSVSPTSVVEGGGSTSVAVTATATAKMFSATDVTVSVGKSTDSATEGTDYPTVNDFTLTIPKDSKTGTATFKVIPNADKKDSESSETISIDGSSSPHTVTGTSLTLTNATASNPITLSVSPSSLSEGAGETTVTVTARMQTSFKGAGAVTVTVGASGSATSGTDYGAVSDIELSFSADSPTTATGTFKLTPTDDSLVENNETVWVDGSSDYGQVVGASVTINDNDGAAVTLSADTSSIGEGASAKTVTVTATASAASSNAQTVTVSVGRNGDSAIEGTDYSTVSDFSITIAANQTSGTGTFTLTPTQDDVVEGSESLTISGSGTGLNVTGTSVSLTDDDTAPAVNLSLSPTSVTEGASDPLNLVGGGKTVTVTAAFSPAKTYAYDRTVSVSVGGSGSATSGTDYDAVSNFNLKISAGQTSGTATFDLTSTDDSVYEGNETIGVAGTVTGLTVNSATLTLADNDSAAVTVNDASAAEGSSMTFTVTLDTAVQGGLTVTPGFTDVTATEGTDYDENTTAISFSGNANETQTFTVSTTQDAVVEGNETFTVGLSVSGTTLTSRHHLHRHGHGHHPIRQREQRGHRNPDHQRRQRLRG